MIRPREIKGPKDALVEAIETEARVKKPRRCKRNLGVYWTWSVALTKT